MTNASRYALMRHRFAREAQQKPADDYQSEQAALERMRHEMKQDREERARIINDMHARIDRIEAKLALTV